MKKIISVLILSLIAVCCFAGADDKLVLVKNAKGEVIEKFETKSVIFRPTDKSLTVRTPEFEVLYTNAVIEERAFERRNNPEYGFIYIVYVK